MNVGEIGQREVVSVAPDAGVAEVAKNMFRQQVGSVVVTEGEDLVGIVTDRDLVVDLAGEYRRLSADLEGITDVIENESPSR